MTEDEADRLIDLVLHQRARIDVLERGFAVLLSRLPGDLGAKLEASLTAIPETSPLTDDRSLRANQAAILLADMIAGEIAAVRRQLGEA